MIIFKPYHKHSCTKQNCFGINVSTLWKINFEIISISKGFRTTTSPFLSNFANSFSTQTFNLKIILFLKSFKIAKSTSEQFRANHATSPETERLRHNWKDSRVQWHQRFFDHFCSRLPNAFLTSKYKSALHGFFLRIDLGDKFPATKRKTVFCMCSRLIYLTYLSTIWITTVTTTFHASKRSVKS